MTIPPKVKLIDRNGDVVEGNTLPDVGGKRPEESLPVTLALGVEPIQSFVPVQKIDKTNSDTFDDTVALVVPYNETRRYLKIINNGNADVELWTGNKPAPGDVGGDIPKGEILFAGGDGIAESDTVRKSAVYATALHGVSGLFVLEG